MRRRGSRRERSETQLYSIELSNTRTRKVKKLLCTLMFTGKLGSGKPVLLANLVDDLNLDSRNKNITVAYFFC